MSQEKMKVEHHYAMTGLFDHETRRAKSRLGKLMKSVQVRTRCYEVPYALHDNGKDAMLFVSSARLKGDEVEQNVMDLDLSGCDNPRVMRDICLSLILSEGCAFGRRIISKAIFGKPRSPSEIDLVKYTRSSGFSRAPKGPYHWARLYVMSVDIPGYVVSREELHSVAMAAGISKKALDSFERNNAIPTNYSKKKLLGVFNRFTEIADEKLNDTALSYTGVLAYAGFVLPRQTRTIGVASPCPNPDVVNKSDPKNHVKITVLDGEAVGSVVAMTQGEYHDASVTLSEDKWKQSQVASFDGITFACMEPAVFSITSGGFRADEFLKKQAFPLL